ncbi:hypothetical protein [Bradyrhizobium sp. CCBAU 53421]|uniref:hypothetical protein n=1 Tax=Bradyrhizobium sp. CCBAU 53421 TaxID=1325120 RepID=UPI0018BFDBF0|nr:hypothetical protein [Bradyrhizobium sp. CCBAU 53421]QOZ36350.1 hypothetical protein XH92_35760 [Bradyrhizobium sp. CCBAU 53421]
MWIRYRSNYIGFGAAWADAFKRPAAQDPVKALASAKQMGRRSHIHIEVALFSIQTAYQFWQLMGMTEKCHVQSR